MKAFNICLQSLQVTVTITKLHEEKRRNTEEKDLLKKELVRFSFVPCHKSNEKRSSSSCQQWGVLIELTI